MLELRYHLGAASLQKTMDDTIQGYLATCRATWVIPYDEGKVATSATWWMQV